MKGMRLGRAVRYGGVYSDKGPPRLFPVGCLSDSLPAARCGNRTEVTRFRDASALATRRRSQTDRGSTTKTATTMTEQSITGREQPGVNAAQLPKGGFEHPFHGSSHHLKRPQGKEPPRIVSGLDFPAMTAQVFEVTSPGGRAANVCALQLYKRKTQLVGGGE